MNITNPWCFPREFCASERGKANGGVAALKAISGPYSKLTFMPTGLARTGRILADLPWNWAAWAMKKLDVVKMMRNDEEWWGWHLTLDNFRWSRWLTGDLGTWIYQEHMVTHGKFELGKDLGRNIDQTTCHEVSIKHREKPAGECEMVVLYFLDTGAILYIYT